MSIHSNIVNDLGIKVVIYLGAILVYNSIRKRSKLRRAALLGPRESAWNRLLNYGDDQSFLEMTGFNRRTWMQLEDIIFPIHEGIQTKRGRPPVLNDRGQLGLLIFFLGSTMTLSQLCMIFGVVPSSTCIYINRLLKRVYEKYV